MVRPGGIVHIVGETGVGKSRLVTHVRNEMTADHPRLIWLEGRALAQGQGAYGVVADLVRNYLGIGVDDSMAEMLAKLRRRMTHLFPSLESTDGTPLTEDGWGDAAELTPHFANLLSLVSLGPRGARVAQW